MGRATGWRRLSSDSKPSLSRARRQWIKHEVSAGGFGNGGVGWGLGAYHKDTAVSSTAHKSGMPLISSVCPWISVEFLETTSDKILIWLDVCFLRYVCLCGWWLFVIFYCALSTHRYKVIFQLPSWQSRRLASNMRKWIFEPGLGPNVVSSTSSFHKSSTHLKAKCFEYWFLTNFRYCYCSVSTAEIINNMFW